MKKNISEDSPVASSQTDMPNRYHTVLLDADGTLFDFDKAEAAAFRAMLANFALPYSGEIYAIYRRINQEKWRRLEDGTITKERLVRERFSDLFAEIGVTNQDPSICNAYYLDALADCSELMEGAYDVCRILSQSSTLAIVTNGVERTQLRRIARSPIRPFLQDIFVSERVGFAKPDTAYFDFVFAAMGLTDRRGVLIVGDSPGSDILGGIRYGIDTCYFNPSGQPVSDTICPTYEITKLSHLPAIVSRGPSAAGEKEETVK